MEVTSGKTGTRRTVEVVLGGEAVSFDEVTGLRATAGVEAELTSNTHQSAYVDFLELSSGGKTRRRRSKKNFDASTIRLIVTERGRGCSRESQRTRVGEIDRESQESRGERESE